MHKTISKLFATLLIASAVAIPAISFVGCATGNLAAYKTEATTQATVQEALVFWEQYVKSNHPGVTVEQKVKSAFNTWKSAAMLTADAGQVWASAASDTTPNPVAVQAALNAFEMAVGNQHQYQTDFVGLVQTITGKPIIR